MAFSDKKEALLTKNHIVVLYQEESVNIFYYSYQ